MPKSIPKVMGIYEIKCDKTGMIYIGKSEWLGSRWGYHLYELLSGIHKNKPMLNDFNKYGISSFSFLVLEIVKDINDLSAAEVKWISKYPRPILYNIKLVSVSMGTPDQREKFIKYINRKWLLPTDASSTERDDHKIWRERDKKEIIKKYCDCEMTHTPIQYVTFNSVMLDLVQNLGYTVESSRNRIDREQRTCKLIVSHDESLHTILQKENEST